MAARRKKADEVCPEHFPDGIPEGSDGVGCEHGTWSRNEAPAKPADGDEGDE